MCAGQAAAMCHDLAAIKCALDEQGLGVDLSSIPLNEARPGFGEAEMRESVRALPWEEYLAMLAEASEAGWLAGWLAGSTYRIVI